LIRNMVRIAVWGVLSRRSQIVKCLHDLSVLHIDQHSINKLSNKEIDSLRLLRGKLLGMLEALDWKDWNSLEESMLAQARKSFDMPLEETIREINNSLDNFQERLSSILKERDLLKDKSLKLRQAHDVTVHFHNFIKDENKKNRVVSLWWIPSDQQSRIISSVRARLKEISPDTRKDLFEYHTVRMRENENMISFSVESTADPFLEEEMNSAGAVRWTPPVAVKGEELSKVILEIEQELSIIPQRLQGIQEDLVSAKDQWGPKLAALFILADENLEELNVEADTLDREHFFMIEGWLPVDRLNDTIEDLKERFGNDVLIRWRHPTSNEWHSVPTSLYNWTVFRPFEIFLKLMESPGYKSSDPTPLIAIFFPFFSGCMIGDIGYGAIALLIGIFMYRKRSKPLVSDIGYILMIVSLWSFFWGIAYGELFGDVGYRLFNMHPLWIERSHAVLPVLVFTISLGFGHVIIGLLLGIVQGLQKKEHHVWIEKTGNLAMLFGLTFCLVIFKGWLPEQLFTFSISLLITGLVLLMIGGGIGGLVESFSTIGNILSYVRIAAIGLSSAILAVVASRFIDVFGLSVLGLFLALSIHILNFVLAIGGSSLHSARLHYVEFMGKFYSGGGKQYKPFSRRRGRNWKKP